MPVTPADVGRRVSVRRVLGQRSGRAVLGDVVGDLLSWSGGVLRVRRRDGSVAEIDEDTVVAGRVVPPARTYRRRSPAAVTSAESLERVAAAGWRATETEPLGEWLLRCAGGFTGRANSALAVGDPRTDLADALKHVRAWYEGRRLPPRVQVVAGSPLDREITGHGWQVPGSGLHGSPVAVLTAMVADVLDAAGPGDDGPAVRVEREPDDAWLALYRNTERGGEPLPPAARDVLTNHPRVAFAALGDPVVAVGRVAVDPPWAGLFALEVAPGVQRRGLGTATVRTLLRWAAESGADRVYSQVSTANAPGLALHTALGFASHHEYVYRVAHPPRRTAHP